MHHIGKVLQLFKPNHKNIKSASKSTEAMLEMWDENIITVKVSPSLKSIKKHDVVLVDYTKPPKFMVTKILKGSIAKETWETYKQHYEKKLSEAIKRRQTRIPIKRHESYVG